MRRFGTGLTLALVSSACEPELDLGTWTCPPAEPDQAPGNPDKRVDAPWFTGFELGFCDYGLAGGICFSDQEATFSIVDSPVHGGRKAAAFSVPNDPSKQARCFREGALPREAIYGAWFYVPPLEDDTGDWNLMHFQGGDDLHNLWDVSMRSADDGSLYLYALNLLSGPSPAPPAPPPEVPIGSWFHLEFRLLRAADTTGEIALYQDGALIYELTDIVTDDTDFAQWYVGNYVHESTLPTSTLYVDDVTVRAP